jgi:hypothetical protein
MYDETIINYSSVVNVIYYYKLTPISTNKLVLSQNNLKEEKEK